MPHTPEKNNGIRILSQYFHPDVANTGQLLFELAVGFVREGIATEVITARPSYDNTIDASGRETISGVTIRRVPATRLNKNTIAGKVLNALSYFFSALIVLLTSESTDPLLIVSNPPFLPFLGVILKRLKKVDYIFLVHDIYPDIAVQLGYLSSGGIIERVWHRLNGRIFRDASDIIVLSESMRGRILQKIDEGNYPTGAPGVSVIYNWADGSFIAPKKFHDNPFIRRYGLEGNFIVQYSGNMGLFHDLECVIEAARLTGDEDCRFLFIGGGGKKAKLEEMAARYSLRNVLFLPYQPRALLPESLTAANLAIVTLEKGIEGLAMPSKLSTILAAGVPVAAFCDEGSDIAGIIQEGECGVALRQGDSEGLLRIIQKLKSDPDLQTTMGRNARRCYEKFFTFDSALARYLDIIRKHPHHQVA